MEDDRINWNSRAQSGETEETREVIRSYLPMREYDEIEANGYHFCATVEVEKRGENISVIPADEGATYLIYMWQFGERVAIPKKFEDSYISLTGPTWRELIEREICRQAAELPGWKNEYKED